MTSEPAASQTTTGKADLSEERQWQLALASLQRANESTNYLRTLMFVAATGLVFFVLPEIRAALPRGVLLWHMAALALSIVAVCMLFYAWHIQRVKARERFNYLRDGNYQAYLQYDKAVETISSKRDSRMDTLAFLVLLAAFIVEIAARYQALSIVVPVPAVPGVHV
jgi:hypothetical protein